MRTEIDEIAEELVEAVELHLVNGLNDVLADLDLDDDQYESLYDELRDTALADVVAILERTFLGGGDE